MTTTDRLLADLIAHVYYPNSGMSRRRTSYAAERLALAEQRAQTVTLPSFTPDQLEYLEKLKPQPVDMSTVIGGPQKPAAPPRADRFEAARQRAHDLLRSHWADYENGTVKGEFDAALDAFISAMPPQQAETQPEEVPEEVRDAIYDRNAGYADNGGTEYDHRAIEDEIWTAARRYTPMPASVTEEMKQAAAIAARACGWSMSPSAYEDLCAVLEAALAAAPKE